MAGSTGEAVQIWVRPLISERGETVALEVCAGVRGRDGVDGQWLAELGQVDDPEALDRWAVETATVALAEGRIESASSHRLSIALSSATVGRAEFLEFVIDSIDRTGVEHDRLGFEVPANAFEGDSEHVRRFVGVMHGMGVRLGLRLDTDRLDNHERLRLLIFDYLRVSRLRTPSGVRHVGETPEALSLIELVRASGTPVVRD